MIRHPYISAVHSRPARKRRGAGRASAGGTCAAALLLFVMLSLAACATSETATRTPAPEPPSGPVTSTVEGYRIQIAMSNDLAEADEYVEAAVDWYQGLPASNRPPYLGQSDLDVQVAWKAPYYRVWVGKFASRAEAERALDAVSRRFPDAFPVPAVVTVTR